MGLLDTGLENENFRRNDTFIAAKRKISTTNQKERAKRRIPLLPILPICLELPRISEGSGGRTEPWLNNNDDGYD